MDIFKELENMAINAAQEAQHDWEEPSAETIKRWQELFPYSHAEASELIRRHRTDLGRKQVSDAHWAIVRGQMESQGYDREAYEHKLESGTRMPKKHTSSSDISPLQARAIYLLKLEGALDTSKKVQEAGNLIRLPETLQGTGEDGDATFCQVDGCTKLEIDDWVSRQDLKFQPVFIRIKMAYKELSNESIYPTLGQNSTLPQYRPQEAHLQTDTRSFIPSQSQYPVWYFFYGTLTSVSKLTSVLSLNDGSTPILHPASIAGGKLQTWGMVKYNALVDGPESSSVHGSAYQVLTREHEEFLRLFETDMYEVVRCTISTDFGNLQGCTFRFIGETD
ncbi:hypothetical protein BP6252_06525 [Coleophoma cylindrospora]|uniref:Putative gamma-glutamylcyclotransferase n=1 Tax=Coleophoma cylindrospora TaxID=1849047 RepID=A0A3D8RMW2_9HELO|nr:hypothetical protein BP6252_06525 [Coleophoma cylindrospora]